MEFCTEFDKTTFVIFISLISLLTQINITRITMLQLLFIKGNAQYQCYLHNMIALPD